METWWSLTREQRARRAVSLKKARAAKARKAEAVRLEAEKRVREEEKRRRDEELRGDAWMIDRRPVWKRLISRK